jgi:hypothetical protein
MRRAKLQQLSSFNSRSNNLTGPEFPSQKNSKILQLLKRKERDSSSATSIRVEDNRGGLSAFEIFENCINHGVSTLGHQFSIKEASPHTGSDAQSPPLQDKSM